MKINFTKKQKGYALLMAVMVSSLFLIIAGTVAKIAAVEIILSSIGRESQLAFYAADAGIECALYWDRHYAPTIMDATSDPSGSAFTLHNPNDPTYDGDMVNHYNGNEMGSSNRELIIANGNSGTNNTTQIKCGGTKVTNFSKGDPFSVATAGLTGPTFFSVNGLLNNSCVQVSVTKTPNVAGTALKTTVVARGYNTCDLTNPRRLERALQVVSQ